MSQTADKTNAERWLQTAEEDLDTVRLLIEHDRFAHAAFLSQQAAEKAVKALWYATGEQPWGHSIQKLIQTCPVRSELQNATELIHRAARLDRLYIPTRYPNGLPDLTPGQVYHAEDARAALEDAEAILTECRRCVQSR